MIPRRGMVYRFKGPDDTCRAEEGDYLIVNDAQVCLFRTLPEPLAEEFRKAVASLDPPPDPSARPGRPQLRVERGGLA